MDAWHWATLVALLILTVGEVIGGYFAFRRTIVEEFEPPRLHPPDPGGPGRVVRTHAEDELATPDAIQPWMRLWLRYTWSAKDPEDGSTLGYYYEWRCSKMSRGTGILIRTVIRIAVAGFMLVRFGVGESGL